MNTDAMINDIFEKIKEYNLGFHDTKNTLETITEALKRPLDYFAKQGDLEKIKLFRYLGYKYSNSTFKSAALYGDLRIMKFLKEQGCPWDSSTFKFAAKNGNVENLRWLHAQSCPWDKWTFSYAALNGNLDNMKWLKGQGCPWDEWTFIYATENGTLDNMKWLYLHGCPYDKYTISTAVYYGNLDVLNWMYSEGFPFDFDVLLKKKLTPAVRKWLEEKQKSKENTKKGGCILMDVMYLGSTTPTTLKRGPFLFYSEHCKYSQDFISKLHQSDKANFFTKVCIDKDATTGQRPPAVYYHNITDVPTIIVDSQKLSGIEAFEWLENNTTKEPKREATDKSEYTSNKRRKLN